MEHRTTWVSVIFLAVTLPAAPGTQAATVPGEKWQQTTTVKMQGMTMPMGMQEVCAPVGKADEQLLKPNKDCIVSNVQRSGNRLSANVACTGKEPVRGTMVLVGDADHMNGTMNIVSNDGEMTMVTDSKKVGACQAVDTEALVTAAKRSAAAAPQVDVCGSISDMVKKDAAKVVGAASMFITDGGQCAKAPGKTDYCAAVQTRKGFSALAQAESSMRDVTSRSVSYCGLSQGKTGVDALRAKLVASAEADGDAAFLEAHAPARLKQIARSECVLKGEMWGGKSAKWDVFCDSNFAAEARGRR